MMDEEPFDDDVQYDYDENYETSNNNKMTVYKKNDKNSYLTEINNINSVLFNLEMSMNKYIEDSKKIWDSEFSPFFNSSDCLILQNINENEYSTFIDFMIEQKTFRLMLNANVRLKKRLEYLLEQTKQIII